MKHSTPVAANVISVSQNDGKFCVVARDGVGFINEHAKDDSPFFLYYAFAHMHVNSPSAQPASLLRALG